MTRDDRPERRLFEVFNRQVKLLTRRDDGMRGVPRDMPGDGGVGPWVAMDTVGEFVQDPENTELSIRWSS
jgi:hypothetical protein